MLHAVIMAGGSGTRFWPESRAAHPKQLLRLVDERTMIQSTVDRLATLVPAERMLIVTNRNLVDEIHRQLPELPPRALIGEPCRRDTAPCIGLAALEVMRDDPEAVMAVMPSDHVIAPAETFCRAIEQAQQLVEQCPGGLLPLASSPRIRPNRSDTSNGANCWPTACTACGAFAKNPRPRWRGSLSPKARSTGTRASSCGRRPRSCKRSTSGSRR